MRRIAGLILAAAAAAQAQVGAPADARKALIEAPNRESLLAYHQMLASEPHVAGTPGDERVIAGILDAFEKMGLKAERHDFWAYMPLPIAAELEIIEPDHVYIELREKPLAADQSPANPAVSFGWNAYSADGNVTAQVVYANYGTKADFEKLREWGIDLKGKIVLARYGGNFRGYKEKFAAAAGAAGLVIFTDPSDSGYAKGLLYPEGGFANDCCLQRGSILTTPYAGDPLTPGTPATEDAQRLDPADVAFPKIPVQPVSYAAAREIMSRMTGRGLPPDVQTAWQGGLPFPYRLEGGPQLKVHLLVKQERAIRKSANVIATLPGESPDAPMLVIGCHHDAWVNGAADPTCGTIVLLETAKNLAALATSGVKPMRTTVFCAWGAEEFGIIGSTEWVEANRELLMARGAAYINLDMASMGVEFGSAATPSLRRVIMEEAAHVPLARAKEPMTALADWLKRAPDAANPGHPNFGDVGGGSDHVAFLCFAGVPSCGLSAGGSRGWSYHSAYDSLPWYWKVVGDDYAPAKMVTQATSLIARRFASDTILPLDPSEYAVDFRIKLKKLAERATKDGTIKVDDDASKAIAALDAQAADIAERGAAAIAAILEAAADRRMTDKRIADVNARLMACDRLWMDEKGLPERPWYKNRYAAPDEDSGYASWILPELCRAVDRKDRIALDASLNSYAGLLTRLNAELTALK